MHYWIFKSHFESKTVWNKNGRHIKMHCQIPNGESLVDESLIEQYSVFATSLCVIVLFCLSLCPAFCVFFVCMCVNKGPCQCAFVSHWVQLHLLLYGSLIEPYIPSWAWVEQSKKTIKRYHSSRSDGPPPPLAQPTAIHSSSLEAGDARTSCNIKKNPLQHDFQPVGYISGETNPIFF